jgi:hypothetical protein
LLERAATRRRIEVDEVTRRWDDAGVIYGTPGRVAESVAALEEAGLERLYLQWLDLADYDGMARMLELVRR